MKRKDYSSPDMEIVSLSLSKDVLGVSTNPTTYYEHGSGSGDDGFEGGL